ncbi:MAG: 3-oxoacyl-ACP synthase [Myxococcales bacterium]|nr:3-oxoacyl-ACP synthase [Myxococcales bacterium]
MTRLYTRVAGTGHHVPEHVVTNEDLAARINTSDVWIRERTGIRERRFSQDGESTAQLALRASLRALEDAGCAASDLDLIVFATLSPDYFFPGSGVLLGALLDIPGVPALDVRNQCSGFLYGLQCADAMIRSGVYRRILLVGAEVHSTGLDISDQGRDIAVLFGDGAGAFILEAAEQEEGAPRGVLGVRLGADGRHAEALWCQAPSSAQFPARITAENLARREHFPQMKGRLVFKHAVTTMRDAMLGLLEELEISLNQVDLLIPHQANLRISALVQKALALPDDRVFNNIERYGNTTAASLPIAVDESLRLGRLKEGDLLALVAFGSGFTWGASLIRM